MADIVIDNFRKMLHTIFHVLKEFFISATSYFYYSLKNRDKNIWVFGEWFGNRCCDNCLFLSNYIAEHYPEIKLYWISKDGTDLSLLNRSIVRLVMDSKEAIDILRKAGVVVVVQDGRDLTQKPYLYYAGALTVNLWHGVPWKNIGIDVAKNSQDISSRTLLYVKMQYYFFGEKYYLSLSDEFSKIMKSAFERGDDGIICSGYPRNMLFYNEDSVAVSREKLKSYLLEKYGYILNNDVRVITYMPTFRDNKDDVFSFISIDGKNIQSRLEQWNAVLLEKSHYVTSYRNGDQSGNSGRIFSVDGSYLSQELLAASDILITDYSSCFFDYLLLDRPIIHYLYDYDYYSSADRGLYYKKEDVVCGDVACDFSELITMINDNISNPDKNHDLRKKRKSHYMKYESSNSCQEIFDFINK